MPTKGEKNAPLPPAKYKSKAKEKVSATEARDLDPDTVPPAARRRKVAPDAIPPPPTACARVNSGGGTKVQVLQEKSVPTNAPRKRKERIKTVLDASLKDDNEHEPPRKKSRRADPPSKRYAVLFHDQRSTSPTSPLLAYFLRAQMWTFFWRMLYSRGRKENKEMSRSAPEGSKVGMDKVRLF